MEKDKEQPRPTIMGQFVYDPNTDQGSILANVPAIQALQIFQNLVISMLTEGANNEKIRTTDSLETGPIRPGPGEPEV